MDNEEALSPNLKGVHDKPLQENLRNDGNRTSSEDEWVDVRVPDGKKDNSLPLMTQVIIATTCVTVFSLFI